MPKGNTIDSGLQLTNVVLDVLPTVLKIISNLFSSSFHLSFDSGLGSHRHELKLSLEHNGVVRHLRSQVGQIRYTLIAKRYFLSYLVNGSLLLA